MGMKGSGSPTGEGAGSRREFHCFSDANQNLRFFQIGIIAADD